MNAVQPITTDLDPSHVRPHRLEMPASGRTVRSHFSHYFALMEQCRDDALRKLLPNVDQYLGQGFELNTEYAGIDFTHVQRLFEHVVVRMECLSLSRTRMELGFEFLRESDGTLLCTGRNAIVWVNTQGHPAIMPQELFDNLSLRSDPPTGRAPSRASM